MHILLDTHIHIWHLEDDPQLSLDSSFLITDPLNTAYINFAVFGNWLSN